MKTYGLHLEVVVTSIFFPFPTMFSEAFSLRVVKSWGSHCQVTNSSSYKKLALSPFPTVFSTFSKTRSSFEHIIQICLHNALNLDMSNYRLSLSTTQPFPKQALVFTCLQYKSFEKAVGKGEIAHNEQFLLFPKCFLPFWRTFCRFIKFKIVVCKLFQFRRV